MSDFKRFRTDATGVSSIAPPPTVAQLPVMLIGQASGMENAVQIADLMTPVSSYALLQYLNNPGEGIVVPSVIQCAAANAGYVLAVQANGSYAFEPAGTSGGFTPNRAIVSAASTGVLTTATSSGAAGGILTEQNGVPPAFQQTITITGAAQFGGLTTAIGGITTASNITLTASGALSLTSGNITMTSGSISMSSSSTVTAGAFLTVAASPYTGTATLVSGTVTVSFDPSLGITSSSTVLVTRVTANTSTALGILTAVCGTNNCTITAVSASSPGSAVAADVSTIYYQVVAITAL